MQVKKLTALLLALGMLLSLLPAAAIAAENEDYELRVLTFEDADYKAGTNFAGGSNWSSLIDEPQYGGKLLYGSGSGVSSADEAYNWTDSGNTELFSRLSEGYGSWCYWSGGHAVSNYNSGDIADHGGFNTQLTVYKAGVAGLSRTGGGHNGSDNFAVHFGYADNSDYGLKEDALPALSFADNAERVIDSMWVTNTTYALNCYIDGNGLTAKIGDDDWVKLVATGYNAAGAKTGTAELYLCNGPKNIVMDWTKWDLSGLGKVQRVTFNVTGSSDNGYGFSQPAYFAYDDVAVRFEKEAKPVPATGVTLNRQALSLSVGETAALTAAPQPENTTDALSWSSSAPAVASVKDGVVTALLAGETVITAACGSVQATCAVTVTQPPLSVKAGDTACVVKQAGENIYHASAAYGSSVTIEVKDAQFLMVTDSKQGYINDEGANPFTLTAAQLEKLLLADGAELPFTPTQASKVAYLSIMDAAAGNTYELYIELTRELTPATEITLDRTELSLKLNETAALKASVQPENTTDTLSWSSSAPEVASVKDGLVTALAPGKATITAACGSVQAQCAVTVAEAVLAQSVVLSKAELKLYTGDTAKLSAEVLPADTTDKTVTWSSSNQEVATVEGGRITALKAGESEITARCGEAKASCRLRVEDAAEPALTDGVYQIGTASELVWFAKHGYAVASVEYSATAKTRFPMQIEDIKEAIRYLRAHAEEFGIDPERVAIMGESSGGYLAAFTAMTNGCAEYETGDHRDQSSDVRAAVVMYLVVTPETMYDEIKKPIPMPDARSYPDLCGMAKTGMPPFLILCGDGDVCCPTSQSERLHDALEREGNDVELLIFENTAHADLPLFQAESKARIDEFLREKMK